MPNYGEQIISKVIDNNDVDAFKRLDIDEAMFPTEEERKAYRFIRSYADENGGQAPSYATLTAECNIQYIPQVSDSYEYLAKQIKNYAGKLDMREYFMGQFQQDFSELETNVLADQLIKYLEGVKMRTNVLNKIGKTFDELRVEAYDEYQKRKSGKSFKLWKTPFDSLNKEIGGLYSGDVYGIFGESGRGKSYLTIAFVDELLRQGAHVLVKSFELKSYLWISRLFSIATARDEVFKDPRTNQKLGLPNKQILAGQLDGEIEEFFFDMLDRINDYYPGKLYLQAKGDKELTRTLDDLERELKQHPEIDAVVADAFYGFSDVYGRNSNKTTGGAAEQAARRFEIIVGENDVVGIYTVQATVEKKNRDEDDRRELKLPTRDQVKTTKALLDIATNLFSFDSNNDGEARLGVEKGRNGAEDFVLNLIALLDYGVLREFPSGQEITNQFQNVF